MVRSLYMGFHAPTIDTLPDSQIEWGHAFGPTWGLGVGQRGNTTAHSLVGQYHG